MIDRQQMERPSGHVRPALARSILHLDVETYSSVDLTQSGLYAYVESPDFEILLLAYALNDEPVEVLDLVNPDTRLPARLLEALCDPKIIKTAFNAPFERLCLDRYLLCPIDPREWHDTMIHAWTLGLAGGLEAVAKAMRVPVQKDTAGKALIRYFSVPCKPTKANGGRGRNLPEHDPVRWEAFKRYNAHDVEVERAIGQRLESYPVLESEWTLWQLDQAINDRGIRMDRLLVQRAIECDSLFQSRLEAEAIQLTGLENPNSVAQLKSWLQEVQGLEVGSLNKESIPVLQAQAQTEAGRRVLSLRQQMAKTSVKKYQAMGRAVGQDSRIRGLLQFYGATRTGRWSGRLVQIQNLPRNTLKDLDLARELLLAGEYETLDLLFGNVPDVLSQLIRTAFVPSPGCRLIVADFSAIEARVIAWLAGENWRLEVFRTHGQIYEASIAQMLHIQLEEVTKELRQRGKVAELALGYQGGPNALIKMGALEKGLREEELPEIVMRWREANPCIVRLWRDLEEAALTAVADRTGISLQRGIRFSCESSILFVRLPSGRRLAYVRPRIENDPLYGKPTVTYEGQELGQWKRLKAYGGRWAENVTQAIARDCLAVGLERADAAGYPIVMHVHDELVCDSPYGEGSAEELAELLGRSVSWAPGLPLRAEAFEAAYYRKDD